MTRLAEKKKQISDGLRQGKKKITVSLTGSEATRLSRYFNVAVLPVPTELPVKERQKIREYTFFSQ